MEIKINRNIFLKEIQKIQNITPIKATKPILSSFLLNTSEDGIYVSATDLKVGVKIFIPAEIITPGQICLPARFVYDILRELPDDAFINLILEENNRLRFTCLDSVFHVPSTSSVEFPPFPEFDMENMYPVPLDLLMDMFIKVNISVPLVEQKLYGAPAGALFVIDNSGIEMAGTDGLRMSYVRLNGLDLPVQKSTVLPKKLLDELPRMVIDIDINKEDEAGGEKDIDTKFALTDNQVLFSWPYTQVFACLLENKFPDYKGPIGVKNDKVIILNREHFRQAVRRVSLISEKREWFIRFKLTSGKLYLDAEKAELGDAHDEIEVDYQGEPLDIGFNPRYILDFLSVISSPEVSLEMSNYKSLAILSPKDNENIKFIIMPVRL